MEGEQTCVQRATEIITANLKSWQGRKEQADFKLVACDNFLWQAGTPQSWQLILWIRILWVRLTQWWALGENEEAVERIALCEAALDELSQDQSDYAKTIEALCRYDEDTSLLEAPKFPGFGDSQDGMSNVGFHTSIHRPLIEELRKLRQPKEEMVMAL